MTDQEQKMQEWLDLKAKNPATYVMPYAAPPRQADAVRTIQPLDVQLPDNVRVVSNATYEDRAVAFVRITNRMGWIVALFAVGLLTVAWDWPLLAGATLLVGLGMYLCVWLLAFIIHSMLTPDFVVLFREIMVWRYINRR